MRARRDQLQLASTARSRYGVLVVLREQRTHRQRVEHLTGKVGDSLKVLAAEIDRLHEQDEDWRVSCISSPSTIYRDLQGARGLPGEERFSQDGDPILTLSYEAQTVEAAYLGKIGRLDLLEPLRHRIYAGSRELPLSRRQNRLLAEDSS